MYGNLVSSDILPRFMFFPTYKTPNKGISRVLARLGPSLGASRDHPPFSPKVEEK